MGLAALSVGCSSTNAPSDSGTFGLSDLRASATSLLGCRQAGAECRVDGNAEASICIAQEAECVTGTKDPEADVCAGEFPPGSADFLACLGLNLECQDALLSYFSSLERGDLQGIEPGICEAGVIGEGLTPGAGCFIGGCGSEICSDDPHAISTCEARETDACYQRFGVCGRQENGACGWNDTANLRACLQKPGDQISGGCHVGGCSNQLCTDEPGAVSTCEWLAEYACYPEFGVCARQADGACNWTPTDDLSACLASPPDASVL